MGRFRDGLAAVVRALAGHPPDDLRDGAMFRWNAPAGMFEQVTATPSATPATLATRDANGASAFMTVETRAAVLVQPDDKPTPPGDGSSCNLFLRDGKLVIQFRDGKTVRHKFIDLRGNAVTWSHSERMP